MAEEKTIRCSKCYEEFTDEESNGLKCCPKCGSSGMPMLVRHDVEVKINWHELMVICNWAESWSLIKCDDDARETLDKILDRLSKFRPEGGPALTLTREVMELQETYPKATLVYGKTLIPPKKGGEA